MPAQVSWIAWFEEVGRKDVATVGGKNASLGEMVRTLATDGIKVPSGFATTADAYRNYLAHNNLGAAITALIADWNEGRATLAETGHAIRGLLLKGNWPAELAAEITAAYRKLGARNRVQALMRMGPASPLQA